MGSPSSSTESSPTATRNNSPIPELQHVTKEETPFKEPKIDSRHRSHKIRNKLLTEEDSIFIETLQASLTLAEKSLPEDRREANATDSSEDHPAPEIVPSVSASREREGSSAQVGQNAEQLPDSFEQVSARKQSLLHSWEDSSSPGEESAAESAAEVERSLTTYTNHEGDLIQGKTFRQGAKRKATEQDCGESAAKRR